MISGSVCGFILGGIIILWLIAGCFDDFAAERCEKNTPSFFLWHFHCLMHDKAQLEAFEKVKEEFKIADRMETDEFGAMYGNGEYTAVYGEGNEESYVMDSSGRHVVEGLAPTLKIIRGLKLKQ